MLEENAMQVVLKNHGRYVVVRSFGASADEAELRGLEIKAHDYIMQYGGQQVFDFSAQPRAIELQRLSDSIQSIVQNGPHLLFDHIYDKIGFSQLESDMLRNLVVSRVCQPRCKLATVDYLRRVCNVNVDVHTIYYWCPLNFLSIEKIRSASLIGLRPFFVIFVLTTKLQ